MISKIDIFSGFLGAGKTMLIKKLLKEKVYNQNTAIIENEFGEVGIDGSILQEENIVVKEINAGCICCQVTGNFINAIVEVIDKYKPEKIIIEPSGVAKLSEILNILNDEKFKEKFVVDNVVTVIDIQRYDTYLKNFNEFYKDQIKNANTLILSRTQLVTEKEIKDTIKSLTNINAVAEIIYKPWNDISGNELKQTFTLKHKHINNENIFIINKLQNHCAIKKEIKHCAKEIFESYPIDLKNKMSEEELKKKFELIESNKEYGNIIRAKGIIEVIKGGYYTFDYVPNEFQTRKIKWANKRVISVIGSNLNKKELIRLFN